MSPTPFNNTTLHTQKESHNLCPSPLKANKDSHFIKKSASSSSSCCSSSMVDGVVTATTTAKAALPRRHPVIIYTHSPKIIRTHPRDFMALVQKLTGLSKSEEDQELTKTPKSEQENHHRQQHQHQHTNNNNNKNPNKGTMNDDNESTSVITNENGNGSNSMGDGQVNSCFGPPIFDPPNPYFNNIPFFTPNSLDLLCSTQSYYNYPDSMFFMPSMRNSISSPALEGLKESPEFQ